MTRRRQVAGGRREAGRVVGYVRVSTERQAGEGVSLDAQAAKITAMVTVRAASCSNW